MAENAFLTALARSMALCVLLARDLVPHGRPPPAAEQVKAELGRVLGLFDPSFDAMWVHDPAEHVRRFVLAHARDLPRITDAVQDLAHRDHVYATLKYTGKPAIADDDDVESVAAEVAACLGVAVDDPESHADATKLLYATAHMALVKAKP